MTVAIHQPHYLPWLGYFDKMIKSDKFIILDDVQLTDRSPMRRNKFIDRNGKEMLLSVDLYKKNYQERKTRDIRLNYEGQWNKKHERFLFLNYNRHPYFDEIWPHIEKIFFKAYAYLLDIQMDGIAIMRSFLDISTPIIMQSSLSYEPDAKNTNLMLSLCKCVSARTYLSGRGAIAYMNDNAFDEAGIRIVYQEFSCPEYKQMNSPELFIPNLSTLDLLFNYGINKSREKFRNNIIHECCG
jgi:hypothetical protein